MSYFSPHCPRCGKGDEVDIVLHGNHRYDTYYCRRCKYTFNSKEGYPEMTESIYTVTENSITWSGEFLVSSN